MDVTAALRNLVLLLAWLPLAGAVRTVDENEAAERFDAYHVEQQARLMELVRARNGSHITLADIDQLALAQGAGRKPEENSLEDFQGTPKLATVLDGDMLIREEDNISIAVDEDGESFVQLRGGPKDGRGMDPWPHGVVDYRFSKEVDAKNRFMTALFRQATKAWMASVPCLSFLDHTGERWNPTKPILEVTFSSVLSGGGCWSYVGYGHNPMNWLNLDANGCGYFGIAVHEIGHALGLFHEQSRWDRDSYLQIFWHNIQPGREHNFRKESKSYIKDEYDYGSIMHYDLKSFSISTLKDTMAPLQHRSPGTEIGQRDSVSPQDAAKVNDMYQCKQGIQVRPCVPAVQRCPWDYECGVLDDGCGGEIFCGYMHSATCQDYRDICIDHKCNAPCVPRLSCSPNACGFEPDGCGGFVRCNECPLGHTCFQHQCRCIPQTFSCKTGECGYREDECGNRIACNDCPSGKACFDGLCRCMPRQLCDPDECGWKPDGCGGNIYCGKCCV